MIKKLFIFSIFFLILSCNNKQEILAEVEGVVVDKAEYLVRLKEARKKMSLPDNGEVRRAVLQKMVNEKLFIVEAKNKGFDSDKQGLEKLERLKTQQLLDVYVRNEILPKVNIDEEKIQRFYRLNEIKLKARHLYAASKQEADSLYKLLQNGASFENLAKQVFNDPYLKNRGGDLGYFTYNDMEPNFSEMAYSLKVGEISPPVKTNYGYSIIRVDERIGNPLTTETEYLKKRSKLLTMLTKNENKQAVKRHSDSLAKELEISFNQRVVDKIFKQIKSEKIKNKSLEDVFQLADNLQDEDALIASTKMGALKIGEFKKLARLTSDGQRSWIKNKENMKDFITGILVRKFILQRAHNKGFDKSESYKNKVKWTFDSYLIDRMNLAIRNSIQIPRDSLFNYYKQNQQDFLTPPLINLREIVVNDSKLATSIKKRLNKGESFAKLAKKYSTSKSAVYSGETGFLSPPQLENLAGTVFMLKPNQWRGPFEKEKKFVFLQCIEKKESALIPFSNVENKISEKLTNDVFESVVMDKLSEIKSRVKFASYPEKLRELSYN